MNGIKEIIKITRLGSMGVKVRENLRFIVKIMVGGMVMRVDGRGGLRWC